jgi:DNA-binding response OmpR family regulator
MSSHTPGCQRSNDRRARASARRPRVLLIDDEIAIRAALTRFFTRRGWEVVEAPDGECARGLLAPNDPRPFDLVICDLRMPRFSGCDFYQWLRDARPDALAKLVFTTGDALAAQSADFLREARRPVLEKPFELSELDRIVDEIPGPVGMV